MPVTDDDPVPNSESVHGGGVNSHLIVDVRVFFDLSFRSLYGTLVLAYLFGNGMEVLFWRSLLLVAVLSVPNFCVLFRFLSLV